MVGSLSLGLACTEQFKVDDTLPFTLEKVMGCIAEQLQAQGAELQKERIIQEALSFELNPKELEARLVGVVVVVVEVITT